MNFFLPDLFVHRPNFKSRLAKAAVLFDCKSVHVINSPSESYTRDLPGMFWVEIAKVRECHLKVAASEVLLGNSSTDSTDNHSASVCYSP